MKLLVINCGSSSIKFALFGAQPLEMVAHGLIERIGEGASASTLYRAGDENALMKENERVVDHAEGFVVMERLFGVSGLLPSFSQLDAVAHRVVHGGEAFSSAVVVDEEVLGTIEKLIPLAPLHNPANLLGIRTAAAYAAVPQIAVFDTAFHHTLPPKAYRYALPKALYEEEGVRRYGFHGTSHAHVADEASRFLGLRADASRLVTLHLGNGASVAAVENGRSVETSMGMTPLEGLMMGSRCGDVDAGVIIHLLRQGVVADADSLEALLNKKSGFVGLCGDNDLRTVMARADEGDADAALALEVYVHRIRKYIGAYAAVMGGVDALVFTGGIGEHAAAIRARVCGGMEWMGVEVDSRRNAEMGQMPYDIASEESRVRVVVVGADEERSIASAAFDVLHDLR